MVSMKSTRNTKKSGTAWDDDTTPWFYSRYWGEEVEPKRTNGVSVTMGLRGNLKVLSTRKPKERLGDRYPPVYIS